MVTTASWASAETVTNTNSSTLHSEPGGFETTASLRPPAVSAVNGKIDYAGGNMNSSVGNNIGGSITFPVLHQFGFQADALYSRISNLNLYGGAAHIFWRDPETGLLGISGGYLHRDGNDVAAVNTFIHLDGTDTADTFQVGVEGQFYYKQLTLGCFGGVESINYEFPTPIIDTNPTKFVGRVSADYYPLENLRVGAAFITALQNNLGRGEIEYQTPIPGIAITGEVAVGDHGYDDWLIGLRYYFGGRKTLRQRQREDDPPSLMPQILQSLGLYDAQYKKQVKTIPPPADGNGGSGGGGGGVIIINPIGPTSLP